MESEHLERSGYFCKNNIWHSKDKPSNNEVGGILTVGLDYSIKPMSMFYLAIMNKKNICNGVMELVNHPAHFNWQGKDKDKYKNECDETILNEVLYNQIQKDINASGPNKESLNHKN